MRLGRGWRALGLLAVASCGGATAHAPHTSQLPSVLLSGSTSHVCAVRDGSVWCWGRNPYGGGIGIGTTDPATEPTRVGIDADWDSVAAGEDHTCAIRRDRSLWCWGNNEVVQRGDVATNISLVPVRISSEAWLRVAAGYGRTAAIRSDGTLWRWETLAGGPTKFGAEDDWIDVSAAEPGACAIRSDGSLWCDVTFAYAPSDQGPSDQPSFKWIAADQKWIRISVQSDTICALDADHAVWCARSLGSAGYRNFGLLFPSEKWRGPLAVGTSTYAVRSDGSTWRLGPNYDVPARVDLPWAPAEIAAGFHYACAIADGGTVWCWCGLYTPECGGNSDDVPRPVAGPLGAP